MFRANAIYEGEYFLGTSIARPLISKRLIEIAKKEKAHYIQYYDKATADVIAEIYKDDLETWNYEFGD